jgi:hypothetical protein
MLRFVIFGSKIVKIHAKTFYKISSNDLKSQTETNAIFSRFFSIIYMNFRYVFMKILVFLTLFFSIQTLWAKETWRYTSFPVVSKNSPLKNNEPEILNVGKKKLRSLMSRQSGTHRLWGVEQVYLSADLKKRVFVKYKVQLNSQKPIGGWIKFPEAHLLHLKKGKDIVAYVAQGFNNLELYELQKQLQGPKVAQQSWPQQLFINCAYAEEVTAPSLAPTPNALQSQTPLAEDQSTIARAANVMACVGSEAIDGAIEKGKALWENATWDNVKAGVGSAASAAWEAVPTTEEVGAGFRAAGNFIQEAWNDPSMMVRGVTERFDKTKQVVAQLMTELSKQIQDFYNLPPEYQDRIACDMIAEFASNGVLSAALAAVASGGVLTAVTLGRAFLEVRKYSRKIALIMRSISMLQGSDLPMDDQMARLNALLKGQTPAAEIIPASGNSGAGVDIRAANAAMRSRSNDDTEKITMLTNTGALSTKERLTTVASELRFNLNTQSKNILDELVQANTTDLAKALKERLGRELNENEIKAIGVIDAHRVASQRGYFDYTQNDLRQKRAILSRAGFSNDEVEYLIRRGLAGQQTPSTNGAAIATAGEANQLRYMKLFNDTTSTRDPYGRPGALQPDIPMTQVPAMASEIRRGLNSGMTRPERDAEASRLGEILLRDYGSSKMHSRAQAEELARHLDQLGYPSANGLKWPLSSEDAMENISRIPLNSTESRLIQYRGTSQFAVTQINERISELSDMYRRRGMNLSEFEAERMIRELRAQKQKLESNILLIDNQLQRNP